MPKAPKAKVGAAKKVVHPNSRKAQYLARKACREQRVVNSKAAASKKTELLADRLAWFHEHGDLEKCMSKADLAKLCIEYLGRFEGELEQINIVRGVGSRQGQQFVARESAITIALEKDNAEVDSIGLEVPDLINGKNLDYFRTWNGEIKFLPNIKLRKMLRKDLDSAYEEMENDDVDEEENNTDDEDN